MAHSRLTHERICCNQSDAAGRLRFGRHWTGGAGHETRCMGRLSWMHTEESREVEMTSHGETREWNYQNRYKHGKAQVECRELRHNDI